MSYDPRDRDGVTTTDELGLASRFDRQRTQLRAVADRIVGSLTEADDALQEAWVRLSRTDAAQIASLEPWLATVVARICLNMLRFRRTHGEQPLDRFLPKPRPSHDMFAVPFEEIATMVYRSPQATRQLASRAPPCARVGAVAGPPRPPPEPSAQGVTYLPRHQRPITWDICPEPRHPLRLRRYLQTGYFGKQ